MTGFIVGLVIGLIAGGALVWLYKSKIQDAVKD